MRTRGSRWWTGTLATCALVSGTLVACGSPAEDKAGAAAPVELTLANAYQSLEYEPAVQAFVDEVARRSGGRLRLDVLPDFGGDQPDVEQRLLTGVATGQADLGWVGTRVLDTVGVDAFAPLTAPFLVDTYTRQAAVFANGLPERMLPALGGAGVTGLAVLGGGLRHPVSAGAPLRTPADWRGATVQTFRSGIQSESLAALGATPTDIVFSALNSALLQGDVNGTEKNLLVYSVNSLENSVPFVVDDVVLWPETSVLFTDPDLRERLDSQQWTWLQEAATAAARQSVDLAATEEGLVADLCDRGARFVSAGPDAVDQFSRAEAPVYDRLRQDPDTAAGLREIEQVLDGMPAAEPLLVPAWCRDTATAGQRRP